MSTKAGDVSSHHGSSLLYQSYRPTNLVKVGTNSVSRLKSVHNQSALLGQSAAKLSNSVHRSALTGGINSNRPMTGTRNHPL